MRFIYHEFGAVTDFRASTTTSIGAFTSVIGASTGMPYVTAINVKFNKFIAGKTIDLFKNSTQESILSEASSKTAKVTIDWTTSPDKDVSLSVFKALFSQGASGKLVFKLTLSNFSTFYFTQSYTFDPLGQTSPGFVRGSIPISGFYYLSDYGYQLDASDIKGASFLVNGINHPVAKNSMSSLSFENNPEYLYNGIQLVATYNSPLAGDDGLVSNTLYPFYNFFYDIDDVSVSLSGNLTSSGSPNSQIWYSQKDGIDKFSSNTPFYTFTPPSMSVSFSVPSKLRKNSIYNTLINAITPSLLSGYLVVHNTPVNIPMAKSQLLPPHSTVRDITPNITSDAAQRLLNNAPILKRVNLSDSGPVYTITISSGEFTNFQGYHSLALILQSQPDVLGNYIYTGYCITNPNDYFEFPSLG